MIKLSKRLQTIADMVTKGNRLADIGTDHGFLPLYLWEQGRIPSGLAMDVNQGPLQRAIEHIERQQCQPYIKTRLSDGLAQLEAGETDTVVIAGMGGGLMVRILTADVEKLSGIKELILQPQSEQAEVRRCLLQLGFQIADEEMLEEDGKYYVVIRAVPQEAEGQSDEASEMNAAADCAAEQEVQGSQEEGLLLEEKQLDLLYGPILLQKQHPVLQEWLVKECAISQEIIDRLSGDHVGEKARERCNEVKEKQRLQKAALARFVRRDAE